jgi:hypothetical protein
VTAIPTKIVCVDCDAPGPEAPSKEAARVAARDAGWARGYRGSREVWRCPVCRPDRRPSPSSLAADEGVKVKLPFATFDRLVAQSKAAGRTLVEHIGLLAEGYEPPSSSS